MLQGMCGSFPASALGIVANFRPGRMAPCGGTSRSKCGEQPVWDVRAALGEAVVIAPGVQRQARRDNGILMACEGQASRLAFPAFLWPFATRSRVRCVLPVRPRRARPWLRPGDRLD